MDVYVSQRAYEGVVTFSEIVWRLELLNYEVVPVEIEVRHREKKPPYQGDIVFEFSSPKNIEDQSPDWGILCYKSAVESHYLRLTEGELPPHALSTRKNSFETCKPAVKNSPQD